MFESRLANRKAIRTTRDKRALVALVALLASLSAASSAYAHFTLISPKSWLNDDAVGAPQKGSPCGPGGFDDVSPLPLSGEIEEFHAGETITVRWTDTIAHPGHFRIALAENRDDLVDPDIVQDGSCSYDETMVPTGAHGNVLADGIAFRSRVGFSDAAGEMFEQEITLPNTPCEKCTLQIMQVMQNDLQFLSNCYYFHCADIKILPAGEVGADAGTAGEGGAAGTVGTGGSAGAAGTVGTGGSAGIVATGGVGGAAGASDVAGTSGTVVMPAAGTTGAATGGTGAVAGTGAAAGASAAGNAAPASDSGGGCSVGNAGRSANHALLASMLLGLCFGLTARRSRRRS